MKLSAVYSFFRISQKFNANLVLESTGFWSLSLPCQQAAPGIQQLAEV